MTDKMLGMFIICELVAIILALVLGAFVQVAFYMFFGVFIGLAMGWVIIHYSGKK